MNKASTLSKEILIWKFYAGYRNSIKIDEFIHLKNHDYSKFFIDVTLLWMVYCNKLCFKILKWNFFSNILPNFSSSSSSSSSFSSLYSHKYNSSTLGVFMVFRHSPYNQSSATFENSSSKLVYDGIFFFKVIFWY